jgi:hypothetical protein
MNRFRKLRERPVVGRAADWGMGPRAASRSTKRAGARIAGLKATESVCPFCAVGCGQVVYTRDGELVDIEGNPRSPINQGTLCPKGAASRQLVDQPGRLTKVRRRYCLGGWEIALDHVKDFGFHEFLSQRFHYARSYAGMRNPELGWKRVLYAGGSPLLIPLVSYRILRNVVQNGRHVRELALAAPLLAVYTAAWTVGEAVGYAFGGGRSLLKVK